MMDCGRKMELQKKAAEHVALCDISSIALGDSKYFDEVRSVFKDRALGIDRSKPRPAMDPTDPATVALITDLTLQASRLR